MSILKKIAINCEQATLLHQQRKEAQLGLLERVGLSIHLAYCSLCARFFKQMDLIENAMKRTADSYSDTPHFTTERKADLQRSLDDQLKK